jgi:hypothetical protein
VWSADDEDLPRQQGPGMVRRCGVPTTRTCHVSRDQGW